MTNLTLPRLHKDSTRTPQGLHKDSTRTPQGLHKDSTRTPQALHKNSTTTTPSPCAQHNMKGQSSAVSSTFFCIPPTDIRHSARCHALHYFISLSGQFPRRVRRLRTG